MDTRGEIIRRTKPFKNNITIVIDDQDTKDIIEEMMRGHKADRRDYDNICLLFDAPTAEEIGFKIWEFLKKNVDYDVETEELQTIRTPGALVATGKTWGADCKNYSLFTGGVIDALNRKTGAGIPWCYRFASYKFFQRTPYHVFVVMYPGDSDEIWIDAVLPEFDMKKKPTHIKDVEPMAIARVSGFQGNPPVWGRQHQRGFNNIGTYIGQDNLDDGSGDEEDTDMPNPADTASTAPPGGDGGFDLSTSQGAGIAQQANPDINDVTNPGLTASTAPPADASPGYVQAEMDAAASNATVDENPSTLSKIFSAFTGGGGTSGGGSGGGGTGAGASTAPKQQQQSGQPTVNVNLPANTSSTNWTPYIVVGVLAIGAIILLTRKK
jgi:hypothetical protein